MFIPLATDIPEDPKITPDIAMPTGPTFATPAAPTSAIPKGLGTFFLPFFFVVLNLHYRLIPSFYPSLMLLFMLLSKSDSY